MGFCSECDGSSGQVLSRTGGMMYVEVVTLTTREAVESPWGQLLCSCSRELVEMGASVEEGDTENTGGPKGQASRSRDGFDEPEKVGLVVNQRLDRCDNC